MQRQTREDRDKTAVYTPRGEASGETAPQTSSLQHQEKTNI